MYIPQWKESKAAWSFFPTVFARFKNLLIRQKSRQKTCEYCRLCRFMSTLRKRVLFTKIKESTFYHKYPKNNAASTISLIPLLNIVYLYCSELSEQLSSFSFWKSEIAFSSFRQPIAVKIFARALYVSFSGFGSWNLNTSSFCRIISAPFQSWLSICLLIHINSIFLQI